MMPVMPKEISNKVEYVPHDIAVIEGMALTDSERKIFEDFREHLRKSDEDRFS